MATDARRHASAGDGTTVHQLFRKLQVTNAIGIHLRAAAEIVRVASAYDATITLEFRDLRADARSVLSILCLAAESGTTVSAVAAGKDAALVLNALERLFASGFGEDQDASVPRPVGSGARRRGTGGCRGVDELNVRGRSLEAISQGGGLGSSGPCGIVGSEGE